MILIIIIIHKITCSLGADQKRKTVAVNARGIYIVASSLGHSPSTVYNSLQHIIIILYGTHIAYIIIGIEITHVYNNNNNVTRVKRLVP